jgi:hypothetical protein
MRSPRPQEWAEVQAFMLRHSPRRQAAVDQLPEGDRKESIKKFVFARFRSLQSLQRRDRMGYEQRLAQLRVEDQIFGLVSDWGGAGEVDKQILRDSLRREVAQLVALDIQERRRRVESLERELAEQKGALERDEQDQDSLVDKRVTRFLEWADRWAAKRAKQAEAEKDQSTNPSSGDDDQRDKKGREGRKRD